MRDNKVKQCVSRKPWGNKEKWIRLLEDKDQRKIWRAINCDGSIEEKNGDIPSDVDFKLHFEKLLDPGNDDNIETLDVTDSPYIPILDDAFTDNEMMKVVKTFKEKKLYRDYNRNFQLPSYGVDNACNGNFESYILR